MEQRIGIIMNGITGRMGLNQHLIRSVLAIRDMGGLPLVDGSKLMPDPILVGRNKQKVEEIAKRLSVSRFTTDLSNALENPDDIILTLQDVIDFVVEYEYDHNDEDTAEMINLGIDLLHMKGIYFSRELVEEDKYGYIGGHAQMRQDSIVSQPVIKDTSFRGF